MAKKKKKKPLIVERDQALALFEVLKYKTAPKWDNERMARNLLNIDEGPAEPLEDAALDDLLDEVLGAQAIEVVDSPSKKKKTTDDDDNGNGDDDFDKDFGDDDAETPKSKKKKKTKKKTAKKKKTPVAKKKAVAPKKKSTKTKSKNRLEVCVDVLTKLPKSGKTKTELVKITDAAYVKAGGTSSHSGAEFALRIVAQVMELVGLLSTDGDKVKPA
jgi:hypothetical protein